MTESAHLFYWNGRGKAEIIRLVLTACGVKFEETHMQSREQFLNLVPSLTFAQLPLLKYGGESFIQSGSTVRTLATRFKLCGKTPQEMYKVDSLYEGTRDFLTPLLGIGFTCGFDEVVEKSKTAVEKYLTVYDKVLLQAGDQAYLVGGSLTVADLGLLEVLLAVKEYHGEGVFESYKGVKKFMETMAREKFYEDYMKNVRKAQNGPEYVALVRKTLAWA